MSSLPTTTNEFVLPSFGSYKNFKPRTSPVAKPKANEVFVKVHAVSLQYRDLAISLDTYYPVAKPNLVPCSDMAGEILAVGEDVQGWKKGDRVCSNFCTEYLDGDTTDKIMQSSLRGQSQGVQTQYKTFSDHALVRIPDHMSYEQASCLPCAALTAYNALHGLVPVKSGDTVLVQGTGGVSTSRWRDCDRYVVLERKVEDRSEARAQHLINYRETPDWDKEVLKITNGRGVDHVVEVGGQGTIARSVKCARRGGFVHVIGVLTGENDKIENIILTAVMRTVHIRGVYTGSVALFKNLIRAIEANPQKIVPIIDKVFEFDDMISAYAHLGSQKHVGKVVIRVAK